MTRLLAAEEIARKLFGRRRATTPGLELEDCIQEGVVAVLEGRSPEAAVRAHITSRRKRETAAPPEAFDQLTSWHADPTRRGLVLTGSNQKKRRLREKRGATGTCHDCGAESYGKRRCEQCERKLREVRRLAMAERAAMGLCQCGRPVEDPAYKTCARCRAWRRARLAEKMASRKPGVCICGRKSGRYKYCEKCRKKRRLAVRQHRGSA